MKWFSWSWKLLIVLMGAVAFALYADSSSSSKSPQALSECAFNSDEADVANDLFTNLRDTIAQNPYGSSPDVELLFDVPPDYRNNFVLLGNQIPISHIHFTYNVGQEPGHPLNPFRDLSFHENNIRVEPQALEALLRHDWDEVSQELQDGFSGAPQIQQLFVTMLESNPPFSYVLRIAQLMMTIAVSQNSGELKVSVKEGKKKKVEHKVVPTFRDVPFEVYILTSRLYHTIAGKSEYQGKTLQGVFQDSMPCILSRVLNDITISGVGLADVVYRMLPDFSRAFVYNLNARENLTAQLSLDELFVRVVALLHVIVNNMDNMMRTFVDVLEKHAHVENQENAIEHFAEVVFEEPAATFKERLNAFMQAWALITAEIKRELDDMSTAEITVADDIPVIHDLNHARHNGDVVMLSTLGSDGDKINEYIGTFVVKEMVRLYALTKDLRSTYGSQKVDDKLNRLFAQGIFSGGLFKSINIKSFADLVRSYDILPDSVKASHLKLPPPPKKDKTSKKDAKNTPLAGAVSAYKSGAKQSDDASLKTVGQQSSKDKKASSSGILIEEVSKNMVKLSK